MFDFDIITKNIIEKKYQFQCFFGDLYKLCDTSTQYEVLTFFANEKFGQVHCDKAEICIHFYTLLNPNGVYQSFQHDSLKMFQLISST